MKPATLLIVANWKMNPQSIRTAKKLFKDIQDKTKRTRFVDVSIAAPFVYLSEIQSLRSGKYMHIAAQDVHSEKMGTFTGEISVPMLKSLGAEHVIIGHSERRSMGESDDLVNKKINSCLKENITPILCVGERKRDGSGHYFSFVEKQLRAAYSGITRAKVEKIIIAYEPVWAISKGDGKGKTATAGDAHEMKLFIQKTLSDIYERNFVRKVQILYGGSVNEKNAEVLLKEGEVDGFLVGGVSLRADEFSHIVKIAESYVAA